ncbi:hypothetical protein FSP39_019028 [Pinctada imbricata]|uniref:Protein HTATIP2 n=1 Tax=Pinctada imbricata TaxID=66713 RepID=A0AA89C2C9_PINIB|nr:hypothetical protein FSP39_019028 [Pinctada imbricata]
MDEDWKDKDEKYKQENHVAFVVGYTGETGKEIVKDLGRRQVFKKVYLLGRRMVDLGKDVGPEFEQRIIDFEDLDKSSDVFAEADVGFCTLGTTRKQSGKSGFIKVDKDFTLNVANVAKQKGCKHFSYCSSYGANANSWFLYMRIKGEVEEALKGMGFDKLTIHRPAMLLCDREQPRFGEKFARCIFRPMIALRPTTGSIPTSVLARGMVNDVISSDTNDVKTLLNRDIHLMAGNVKK